MKRNWKLACVIVTATLIGANLLDAAQPAEGNLLVESVEMQSDTTGGTSTKLGLHCLRGDEAGGAVFGVGAAGSFDADWATCPTVVLSQGKYWMYYSACYDSKMPRGGIGLATSRDGRSWQRENGGQPVLGPGHVDSFDSRLVGHPFLLPESGNRLRIWYTGYANSPGGPNGWRLRIGLAEVLR